MPSDANNPYTAPDSEMRTTDQPSRWPFFLAAISFVLGVPSFLLGAFCLAKVGWLMLTEPITAVRDFMVAACLLFLGFGAAWIMAGWYYLSRQYTYAVIAGSAGVMICVVIFAIMGF